MGTDQTPKPVTVWVLGDQLHRRVASLDRRSPADTQVLMIESTAKLGSKPWHRQRAHMVVAAMRNFANELRAEGFQVDYRQAKSFAVGLADHRKEFKPETVRVMEPMSWDLQVKLEAMAADAAAADLDLVTSNQFLCHYTAFADWATARKSFKLEDFYRWRRRELGYLMDGDEPVGGKWNYDHENREPPPKDGRAWPEPTMVTLGGIDRDTMQAVEASTAAVGASPAGAWPTSRAQALERLHSFVANALPSFGTYQDAMIHGEWHLAHSGLAAAMNIGLLWPDEVCDAVEAAYRSGDVPLNAAEGFIRQVIGWREYVWGVYWLWMPGYRDLNALNATRPLPPVFHDEQARSSSQMRCVADVVERVHAYGYAHHIERLMIIGNLNLLAGVDPWAVVEWMWANFVDAAEWVMVPNVLGMALFADGGKMATKPYAAGGRYINKMSNFCKECAFNPTKRVGDDACPFSTLYWDFLARNEGALRSNHRLGNQLGGMRKLKDLAEVRIRAAEVLELLDSGDL